MYRDLQKQLSYWNDSGIYDMMSLNVSSAILEKNTSILRTKHENLFKDACHRLTTTLRVRTDSMIAYSVVCGDDYAVLRHWLQRPYSTAEIDVNTDQVIMSECERVLLEKLSADRTFPVLYRTMSQFYDHGSHNTSLPIIPRQLRRGLKAVILNRLDLYRTVTIIQYYNALMIVGLDRSIIHNLPDSIGTLFEAELSGLSNLDCLIFPQGDGEHAWLMVAVLGRVVEGYKQVVRIMSIDSEIDASTKDRVDDVVGVCSARVVDWKSEHEHTLVPSIVPCIPSYYRRSSEPLYPIFTGGRESNFITGVDRYPVYVDIRMIPIYFTGLGLQTSPDDKNCAIYAREFAIALRNAINNRKITDITPQNVISTIRDAYYVGTCNRGQHTKYRWNMDVQNIIQFFDGLRKCHELSN